MLLFSAITYLAGGMPAQHLFPSCHLLTQESRPTLTILGTAAPSTSVVTLTLCVYTSIHLNIAPTKKVFGVRRIWIYKFYWVLIAMFAPEFVLYAAYIQWRNARELCKNLRQYDHETVREPFKTIPDLIKDKITEIFRRANPKSGAAAGQTPQNQPESRHLEQPTVQPDMPPSGLRTSEEIPLDSTQQRQLDLLEPRGSDQEKYQSSQDDRIRPVVLPLPPASSPLSQTPVVPPSSVSSPQPQPQPPEAHPVAPPQSLRGQPTRPVSKRWSDITMVSAFYIVMGGFAYDVSDMSDSYNFIALTPKGFEVLAKAGIMDGGQLYRSQGQWKANYFGGVECDCPCWGCRDCVWYKPLAVANPTILQPEFDRWDVPHAEFLARLLEKYDPQFPDHPAIVSISTTPTDVRYPTYPADRNHTLFNVKRQPYILNAEKFEIGGRPDPERGPGPEQKSNQKTKSGRELLQHLWLRLKRSRHGEVEEGRKYNEQEPSQRDIYKTWEKRNDLYRRCVHNLKIDSPGLILLPDQILVLKLGGAPELVTAREPVFISAKYLYLRESQASHQKSSRNENGEKADAMRYIIDEKDGGMTVDPPNYFVHGSVYDSNIRATDFHSGPYSVVFMLPLMRLHGIPIFQPISKDICGEVLV
ncbi:hypothetical protein BDD12DRAFT_808512 [Trichophaea hybrida]|nr:hypothetical protein BDD12DRAFT_808512 [Trichophaea hybrida]